MTDNEQYKNDIKKYTEKYRAAKKIYNPDKYFKTEDASERLYNEIYNKTRNPILPYKNSIIMKSSANLFSNINLNDKKLFTEKKKSIRRKFTNVYLNENISERKKLTEENLKGIKNHKFYKSKGFTYRENNFCTENKFAPPEQYPVNSSKITRQIHLQSNIFGENEKNKNYDMNKIKEGIKLAQQNEEEHPKKNKSKINKYNKIESEENDRNIWDALHNAEFL